MCHTETDQRYVHTHSHRCIEILYAQVCICMHSIYICMYNYVCIMKLVAQNTYRRPSSFHYKIHAMVGTRAITQITDFVSMPGVYKFERGLRGCFDEVQE